MARDPWFDEQAATQRAARDGWLSEWSRCGGTQAEIAAMLEFEPPMRDLLQRGPCGYGPLPEGCSGTAERRLLHHSKVGGYRARRDRRLATAGQAVSRRLARLRVGDDVGEHGLPGILSRLWLWEAHAEERVHAFWIDIDAADIPSDCAACLGYIWALAEGAARDPVLDANLQAVLAGRFPVGLIGGSVIAYAHDADELARLAVDFREKRDERESRMR